MLLSHVTDVPMKYVPLTGCIRKSSLVLNGVQGKKKSIEASLFFHLVLFCFLSFSVLFCFVSLFAVPLRLGDVVGCREAQHIIVALSMHFFPCNEVEAEQQHMKVMITAQGALLVASCLLYHFVEERCWIMALDRGTLPSQFVVQPRKAP